MLTFLIFIIVLSVIVFAHEFGHFIVAKRAGLRVDEFGFGFPPRIVGIQKINGKRKIVWGSPAQIRNDEFQSGKPKDFDIRNGGTLYSLNALPIGGFVKIKGESGENQDEQDSFAHSRALTRALILSAGVTMNVVLAILVIAFGYSVGFPQALDDGLSKYARVRDQHVEVIGVLPNSPADQAGIISGQRLIMANDRAVSSAKDFTEFVTEFLGRPVHVVTSENQTQRDFNVTPIMLEKTGNPGIGVAILDVGIVRYPVWLAIPKAFELTGSLLKSIVLAIGGLIKNAILGESVGADLAGPIGIAVMSGQAAQQGFMYLLQFIAILSLNLAILNILPFPALDGGRILFIVIEKIIRRPVSQKVEGWFHTIGFGLLMLLVIFITYKDVGKYGGRMVEFFKGLI